MIRRGVGPAHQLPRNASSVSGLSILPAGHSGTPHANTVRQQIHCVIHNHQGGFVSKRLCTLVNYLLVWAQNNLRSLKAMHVPGKMNQGADMLSRKNISSEEWTLHPLTVQRIWQGSSRPLRLQRRLSLPNLFYKEHGCPGPRMAQPSALCFPPSRFATAGTQASQGTTAQADSNRTNSGFQSYSSCWKLKAAPWPIPLRWGLLSQANGMIWHPRPELWALHVLPLYGSLSSSQSMS